MFRVLNSGNSQPMSYPLDPSCEFQSGQIAELISIGNQVMATVSKGIAPIGIIDDLRTKAFTNVSWNEVIIAPAIGVPGPNNQLVTPIDVSKELKNPNILSSSFNSTIKVSLNPVNGIITFLAGTPLNYDLLGTGEPNAIRAVVNYTYQVANIPGDDSTFGSGKVTIWFQRMLFETTMYETNQQYPLNANLFVNERGLLTTRKCHANSPCVALCTAPPTSLNGFINAMWL